MSKLVTVVSPVAVVDKLIQTLNNDTVYAREEIINFIIYCLLTYKDLQFNYSTMVNTLTKCISDSRLRVQFVTVEAFAVIRSIIGDISLNPMISGLRCYKLLQERFTHSDLPKLGKNNGTVEHKLLEKLLNNSETRGRPRPSYFGFVFILFFFSNLY